LYSVGTQLVIWLTIGLVAGVLFDRLLKSPERQRLAA